MTVYACDKRSTHISIDGFSVRSSYPPYGTVIVSVPSGDDFELTVGAAREFAHAILTAARH